MISNTQQKVTDAYRDNPFWENTEACEHVVVEANMQLCRAMELIHKERAEKAEALCAYKEKQIMKERKRRQKAERLLKEFNWISIDQDNMEFHTTITCYQMDRIKDIK